MVYSGNAQECHFPLKDFDGSLKEGSALWKWGRKIAAICATLGIDASSALEHGDRLRNRGFTDVSEVHLPCPLGPWAKGQRQKRLGWMARKDLYEGIDGISKKLFLMLGDTEAEVDAFIEKCKEELMDPAVCTTLHPMPLILIRFGC